MTDEEVVKIAQELSQDDWRTLSYNVGLGGNWISSGYAVIDRPLIMQGLLEKQYGIEVRLTDLGKRVWAWATVFRSPGPK